MEFPLILRSRPPCIPIWAAFLATWFSFLLGFSGPLLGQIEARLENAPQKYSPSDDIAGKQSLRLVGSGTMRSLATQWGKAFSEFYPNVHIEIDEKGSGNAIPALIQGQASLGLMSRSPKNTEIESFKERFGYEPKLVPTCYDMLAVFVHRDNPVQSLTFAQLDAIFSDTRRQGALNPILRWNDLHTPIPPRLAQPIRCFGRNSSSGTYGYFKKHVLRNGDYGNWVAEMVGSSNVTLAIGSNIAGIGYSSIGFRNPNVRPLAIGKPGAQYEPSFENAHDELYPLTRFLYLVANDDPRSSLPVVHEEFLKFVLSNEGQQVVLELGLVPLPAKVRKPLFDRLMRQKAEATDSAPATLSSTKTESSHRD